MDHAGFFCPMDSRKTANTKTPISIALEPSDKSPARAIQLAPGESIVIGRASKSSAVRGQSASNNLFFDCPVVSRSHATLHAEPFQFPEDGSSVTLVDEGSMHGTTVNGRRLSPHRPFYLKTGDVIKLGDRITRGEDSHDSVTLTYRLNESPEAAARTDSISSLSVHAPSGFHPPSSPDSDYSSDDFGDYPSPTVDSLSKEATSEAGKDQFGSQEKPIILDQPTTICALGSVEDPYIVAEDEPAIYTTSKTVLPSTIPETVPADASQLKSLLNTVYTKSVAGIPAIPKSQLKAWCTETHMLGTQCSPLHELAEAHEENSPDIEDDKRVLDVCVGTPTSEHESLDSEAESESEPEFESEAESELDRRSESDEEFFRKAEQQGTDPLGDNYSNKAASPELGDFFPGRPFLEGNPTATLQTTAPSFGVFRSTQRYDPVRSLQSGPEPLQQPPKSTLYEDCSFQTVIESSWAPRSPNLNAISSEHLTILPRGNDCSREEFAPLGGHFVAHSEGAELPSHGMDKTAAADAVPSAKNKMDISGLVNAPDSVPDTAPVSVAETQAPTTVSETVMATSTSSPATKRKANEMTESVDAPAASPSKIIRLSTKSRSYLHGVERRMKFPKKEMTFRRVAGEAAKATGYLTLGAVGAVGFLSSVYCEKLIDWLG